MNIFMANGCLSCQGQKAIKNYHYFTITTKKWQQWKWNCRRKDDDNGVDGEFLLFRSAQSRILI